jgi:hypothetical protein
VRWLRALAVCAASVALSTSAHARPGTFSAHLALTVGSLPPVAVSGSGTGTTTTSGGTASIPAGVFSIAQTALLPTPLLNIIFGLAVARAGQVGAKAPLAPGSSLAFQFDGTTGTMGIDASAYLLNQGAKAIGVIPLHVVGVGGAQAFTLLSGLASGTIRGNPFQLGRVTAMGTFGSDPPLTLVATGFDNRDFNGEGVLQVVTPAAVAITGLGTLPVVAVLTMDGFTMVTPEPTTAVLLGSGIAMLAALRRPRAHRNDASAQHTLRTLT